MSNKIALSSTGPLSGKSTLARHLVSQHGFIRADHSRTLVSAFVAAMNNSQRRDQHTWTSRFTEEQVYANKEHYRPQLQRFGRAIGYDDPEQAAMWVETTLKQAGWGGNQPDRDIVFEPVRGAAQAQALKDLGFTIVQLEISEPTRQYRAQQMGRDYEQVWHAMQMRPDIENGIAQPDMRLYCEAEDTPELLADILLHPECCTWWVA